MKPAIIGGIVILAIIAIIASYFALRKSDASPVPVPAESPTPVNTGGAMDEVVDNQIAEIANDVANSAREGYMSRKEYMTPDPAQNVAEFTRIVLSNIVGKPIKAVVSRDDVSGVLKVVMTGVDPTVFEPSVSSISECVSEKIKTANGPEDMPMHVYSCADDYFSANKSEFKDTLVPAALTMYENAYNEYGTKREIEHIKNQGGMKKLMSCEFDQRVGENPEYNSMDDCIKAAQTPDITWDKANTVMKRIFFPSRRSSPAVVDIGPPAEKEE